MLWLSLSGGSATLAEHGGQVRRLGVHLLSARGRHVAYKFVCVDDLFDAGPLVIDHLVGGGEIALLKRVLSRAVAEEQVVGHTCSLVIDSVVVISELLLSLFAQQSKVSMRTLASKHLP